MPSADIHVRRPLKQGDNLRYIVPTVKNASKVVTWAAICAGGRIGLWFMPEGTSIKGTVYLEVNLEVKSHGN